ncbi:MAG TPA: outer membrane beta-barrel protein [Xanthobacteraceae bacterium]|nr:outer membrane beta-barrel protein [Xanthobacteraceae bacterium]
MRRVICAAFALMLAPSALLAPRAYAADLDMDTLRGPLTVGPAAFTRWSGFYAGGQLDYSSGNVDFSHATQPLVSYTLRNTTLEEQEQPSQWSALGNGSAQHTGFGAFAGYNTQWQDLILGIEGNYTHAPISAVASSNPISRIVTAGGIPYAVTISGSGSVQLTDFGSVRARMGYVLGNFLPYGFVGLALGRGNYAISAQVSGEYNQANGGTVPCVVDNVSCLSLNFPANSESKDSALLYGFTVGGGFDMAVTQNIFARAEYEYTQFAPLAGITTAISSVHVGGGFKF